MVSGPEMDSLHHAALTWTHINQSGIPGSQCYTQILIGRREVLLACPVNILHPPGASIAEGNFLDLLAPLPIK